MQDGKEQLCGRLNKLLKTWGRLLQKYLRSEDDQVRSFVNLASLPITHG